MVDTLLVRIAKGEHAQDFKEGKLFMSPLITFATIENMDDKARGDYNEGTFRNLSQEERNLLFSKGDGPILNKSIDGKVSLISDTLLGNNGFCLYSLKIDHERKLIEKPDTRIEEFSYGAQKPPVALCLKDKRIFLNQINSSLDRLFFLKNDGTVEDLQPFHCYRVQIQYALYGEMDYISRHKCLDFTHWRQLFRKEPRFSYQNEWRLILAKVVRDRKPIQYFEIGDQSNNILEIPLYDFINNLEDYFPGYKVVEKLEDYLPFFFFKNSIAFKKDLKRIAQEPYRFMFSIS